MRCLRCVCAFTCNSNISLAQVLHIEASQKYNQQPAFQSALVAGLPRLRCLELFMFGLLHLEHLPASLRMLRVGGSRIYAEDNEVQQQPFVLSLPQRCW